MPQVWPALPSAAKMDGAENFLVLSSTWPMLVPAQVNARLGMVSVGTDANQWSHTAYPVASADSTGSAAGVKQPMIMLSVVPGRTDQPGSLVCQPSVYA